MKEIQNNHYFNEWWKRNAVYALDRLPHGILSDIHPRNKTIVVYHDGRNHIEPAPTFVLEWIANNPYPETTRDKFIVALAKRVEALEAALAEKGGNV